MTAESIEGTEEAADTPTEAAASQTEPALEEVPVTPADKNTAEAIATDKPAAEAEATATPTEAPVNDSPAAETPATEEPGAEPTDEQPAAQATAAAAAEEVSPEIADAATDTTEEAEGRPLGAADQVAEEVEEAVERMEKDAAVAPADEAAAVAPTDEAAADGAASAESATPPTEAEAPLKAAAAPAPRVYEGPEPTTMEELLNEQQTEIKSLKHGDVVEGNIVRIDKDEILVDIGAKSEGVISNRELYGRNTETQPQLNIGDTVLVYVLQPESPEGHAVLSLRRAGLERKWRSMQEQLDAGEIIEAPVIDHNKGGLIVDCGIRGFVPISQIVDFPRRPQNEQPRDAAQEIAEKLQPYVGRKLRLKILEVNRKANRLILSEKVALYEERREKRDELFSSLQVGQKVTGTVRSIAPFGVFVDLGGIDGLVHKSELSWNKVNNPEAGYRVGEEVEAEVIDINHERGRISLSIRRLQPDPWHSTVADLKIGDVIDGTVTKIVNFGAFVRVRDGLEGLIHISELSHQRIAHPGDVVQEGQTLKLKIISLEQERHRLGLSLKQAEEAPARPASGARERRPRQDRNFDMSKAVQEPEGGIDNTLAAAFAQVRAQIQETESSEDTDSTAEAVAEAPAEAEVASDAQPSPEPVAEAPAEATEVAADAADAPATEGEAVEAAADEESKSKAKPGAKTPKAPSKRGKAKAAAVEPDAEAEPAAASSEAPSEAAAEAAAEAAPEAIGDTPEDAEDASKS